MREKKKAVYVNYELIKKELMFYTVVPPSS